MVTDLEKKIIEQIEHYFGDINLPRDMFMQRKMREDGGWISLNILLRFNRLASLSRDPEFIVNAIEKSNNNLVLLSADKKKMRRNPDIPVPKMTLKRRIELSQRTGG